jgi:hypothetical protein
VKRKIKLTRDQTMSSSIRYIKGKASRTCAGPGAMGKEIKLKLLSTTRFGKNINTHIGFSKYVLESEVFKPLQKAQSPTTKLN